MLVRDHMMDDPVRVPVGATLGEAANALDEAAVRQVTVVDGDRVVGIITDRDVRVILGVAAHASDVAAARAEALSVPVSQVMTRTVLMADPFESIRAVASALAEVRVGALPVVDDAERLVGVITVADVLLAVAPVLESVSEAATVHDLLFD